MTLWCEIQMGVTQTCSVAEEDWLVVLILGVWGKPRQLGLLNQIATSNSNLDFGFELWNTSDLNLTMKIGFRLKIEFLMDFELFLIKI